MTGENGSTPRNIVYIDPPSDDYLQNRLFDVDNARLNRDGTLLPFVRVRDALMADGTAVFTADRLMESPANAISHYWSFGIMRAPHELPGRQNVRWRGFILAEPPLVRPDLYAALPELTRNFETVYVHNTTGDGYSLDGVDCGRLRKFFWPQPYNRIDPRAGRHESRTDRIVAISGNHRPGKRMAEHYSTRIKFVSALAELGVMDLYGRGWDRWWGRHSMWWPYWTNYRSLQKAYRGACADKIDVLSKHEFSLCFENMSMDGYITEKIFDCFYAGTIPIYIGPDDATDYLPGDAYIDARMFESPGDIARYCRTLPQAQRQRMREAARSFVEGPDFDAYYNSLETILRT